MAEPLHLVRMNLDPGALVRKGRARGLPMLEVDLGYLIHAWLEGTFGPAVLRPFAVVAGQGREEPPAPGRGHSHVLAYSQRSAEELREEAERYCQEPSDFAALRWEDFSSRPMPTDFPPGTRLGFELTTIPTVRSKVAGDRELDAFEHHRRREGEELPREEVYLRWLRDLFERRQGARLVGGRVERYHRVALLRRTQGERRVSPPLRLPEIRCTGELEVTDPAAMAQMLREGLGRHRAFGYGMLLLRRPAR